MMINKIPATRSGGAVFFKGERFVGIRDIGEAEDRATCFDEAGRGVRSIYARWGTRVCVRPHRREERQALGGPAWSESHHRTRERGRQRRGHRADRYAERSRR